MGPSRKHVKRLATPRLDDLGLERIQSASGLVFSRLPNGELFSLEHASADRRVMINQVLGSAIAGGIGRLCLRVGGPQPAVVPLAAAAAGLRCGVAADRFVWRGAGAGIDHRVSLQLQPEVSAWVWQVEVRNARDTPVPCDVVLIQDLGLGDPGFLMNNEAYASQYLDHHIAKHPRFGPVLMSRQNLAQAGANPWAAHACLQGAAGFATDLLQLLGPAYRDASGLDLPFGSDLPSLRLQHESACAALQSGALTLARGARARWIFVGLYAEDHPLASSDADLALLEAAVPSQLPRQAAPRWRAPVRSVVHEAAALAAECMDAQTLEDAYPLRTHLERSATGIPLSFFVRDELLSRHVVLRGKERTVVRRHGALLRSGRQMLPDEAILCLTCWMHGVFAAQLTIGNTSFHRLFSISRDPYNVTRGSGLRMLVELDGSWRLLTVPSLFEMGLGDCRWIYRCGKRVITVTATVSAEEAAVQWRVVVAGEPCRFLVFGQLVLGEREYGGAAWMTVDEPRRRCSFGPDPQSLWGQRYPRAVYHLVTSTPEQFEAWGGDELLYADGRRRSGGYVALRSAATDGFALAVVGSMTDPQAAQQLAERYASGMHDAQLRAGSTGYWGQLLRGIRIRGADAGTAAHDVALPWLTHDAMVHLTVPHGLEQYTGGAWGTRDVCQGPVELLLTLEHDEPVKAILRIVFAQQYADRGDWPQWFMLEPYSQIQDRDAHGDVIVWPLKALCDYLEATGDFSLLDEPVPWRNETTLQRTTETAPFTQHVAKLLETVSERFVPGTNLIRYGHGDWNDSLQPVDPTKRDWMVSSWTVALLYEQLCRYDEVLRRAGRPVDGSLKLLAAAMRADFNRLLIRDGTIAGYAVFSPQGGTPQLLIHPTDEVTGISYSLLPMTQALIAGLLTAQQAQHHLQLIERHLSFPDGVRLFDRPIAYHGGPQQLFQRAESAAFFGREIGLMYTHAHLRQAQAWAVCSRAQELWEALLLANPVAVTERLPSAALRQRNSYFSSSDAAFADRYQASADWQRVRAGTIEVEGGWRIYSSGPGLYVNVLLRWVFGARRQFGVRVLQPCLPARLTGLALEWPGRRVSDSPPQ
jgi:1,2-beta-oligoglucan phosphorylase